MPWALETENLTRSFGAVKAVDGVCLRVPARCICGFLGPNGSGKTTTLRLILGLLRPDQGHVTVAGVRVSRFARQRSIYQSIGALVESPSLYPHLTGRENLEVARRLLGVNAKRIAEVLAEVGLADDSFKPVRQYSLGMRQRLALALALLASPTLLVLDEPANGLDPAGVLELRDLLRHLVSERGATVILSSHMLYEVEQVADHVAILAHGRLLFQGGLGELRSRAGHALQVRVNRPEPALASLLASGWRSERMDGGLLRVHLANAEEAALVNAHLIAQGFAVSRLVEERPALEALFLESLAGATA